MVPRDARDFKCEYCGQGGFGEQSLKKHIKSNHSRKCFIKDIGNKIHLSKNDHFIKAQV